MSSGLKKFLILTLLSLFCYELHADWVFDFSRRVKKTRQDEYHAPEAGQKQPHLIDMVFSQSKPSQEIVILNTENGFIPSTVRVREGLAYKINIVNVNEKNKNISFVLDSFSEHHSTYYGVIKSFNIQPKKDGVFTFQCPETSYQGKLVVYPGANTRMRMPASKE